MDPRSLLTPDRLDIAVKHRFFRVLMGDDDPGAAQLYRWHIDMRNGGREKRSWKSSVDDFVAAAHSLLCSMRSGFDPARPVPIGNNGNPCDGAHRIACGIALRTEIRIEERDRPGPSWGRRWFAHHGLPEGEVAKLERYLERLKCEWPWR